MVFSKAGARKGKKCPTCGEEVDLVASPCINANAIKQVYRCVGCVPRTHRLIGVTACLSVGRGITPYKVVMEQDVFVLGTGLSPQ